MNAGTGFAGFQSCIAAITDAIGEPTLQPAVAKHAIACLELEARTARGLPSWGRLDWGTWWTTATTLEFDHAIQRTEAKLALARSSLGPNARPTAEAAWRGTVMRLRGADVWVEGGGYKLHVASCLKGYARYDRVKRKDVDQWQVSLDNDFLSAARGGYSDESKAKSTHALSEAAGVKAMRRMMRDFYGVDLTDI
jgi:hypothetical protein